MNLARQIAMAKSLEEIVDASERLRLRHGSELAVADSPAAEEFESATSAQRRRALTESHDQGVKSLLASFDLASGVSELAGRPARAFSVMALLRSASEAAADSHWYLDPMIDGVERERRALGGARDALGAARRFGRKGNLEYSPTQSSALDQLERDIADHPAEPQGLASLENRLRTLARNLELEDRLTDAGLEALSAGTHVGKTARDQIIRGWKEDGQPRLETHVAAEWGIWYGGNLILAAVWSASQYFGWDVETWQVAVAEPAVALQQALNAIRAERAEEPE